MYVDVLKKISCEPPNMSFRAPKKSIKSWHHNVQMIKARNSSKSIIRPDEERFIFRRIPTNES